MAIEIKKGIYPEGLTPEIIADVARPPVQVWDDGCPAVRLPISSEKYLDGHDKFNDPGKHFYIKKLEKEEMKQLLAPIERKLYVLGYEIKQEGDVDLLSLIEKIDTKLDSLDALAKQSTRISHHVKELREAKHLVILELDRRGDLA